MLMRKGSGYFFIKPASNRTAFAERLLERLQTIAVKTSIEKPYVVSPAH